MIPIIEGFIALFWENKIDMLQNLSLSSCSNQTKYSLAFQDFNIDEDYNVPTGFGFNLTEEKWKRKVDSYRTQDERAGRDARKNVSVRDYAWACLEFQNGCYICHVKFDETLNQPTLDRIDNNTSHSKDNVKACCCRCNVYRNQHDADVAKFKIQIHKYAQLKGLPMTLSRDDEKVYWDLMRCKTCGLSVVHNRRNLAGIDTINRLKIDESGKISRLTTDNVITHVIGVDFNSLYPTAFSSEKLSYLDAPILLPGLFERTITCKKQVLDYIKKCPKDKVVFASVKGHCLKTEETINFPPIIRNLNITTHRETIGDFIYDYMKSHDIKTDTQESKLTQLLDTRGGFVTV
jgi:hypothetical protein